MSPHGKFNSPTKFLGTPEVWWDLHKLKFRLLGIKPRQVIQDTRPCCPFAPPRSFVSHLYQSPDEVRNFAVDRYPCHESSSARKKRHQATLSWIEYNPWTNLKQTVRENYTWILDSYHYTLWTTLFKGWYPDQRRRSNHHAFLVRWCDVKVGENVNRWRSGRATKDSVEPLHDHLFMKRNLLQSPPHLPCPLCPLCSWTLRPSNKPWKIIKPQRPHRISSIGVRSGFLLGRRKAGR